MPTRTDFQTLAKTRLKEAQIMYQANLLEGAYYLGGYAIELGFKAAICKTLDWEVFNDAKVAKTFQIHDLSILSIHAGLRNKLVTKRNGSIPFREAWNTVSQWNVDRRYQFPPPSKNAVRNFLTSVDIVLTWIELHW